MYASWHKSYHMRFEWVLSELEKPDWQLCLRYLHPNNANLQLVIKQPLTKLPYALVLNVQKIQNLILYFAMISLQIVGNIPLKRYIWQRVTEKWAELLGNWLPWRLMNKHLQGVQSMGWPHKSAKKQVCRGGEVPKLNEDLVYEI